MNKLFILCGMVFLGITSTPQSPETIESESFETLSPVTLKATWKQDQVGHLNLKSKVCEETVYAEDLDVASILYEEDEEPIELGFDTREYLPENFNPYVTYVDFSAIPYIEGEEEEVFPGTLMALLPEGFNAYAAPVDVMNVSYIEEEDLDLGFDTSEWLPEGFDPYFRDLDLDTIVYIEEGEDLDLGFDTSLYLPKDFDPYSL
ncbi:hypothetical protein [Muriicola marianensis]|uniref:Uncharacterized protein n=1 Tax=Muriicola marianensis TaxID=1324801 RepID=A0ABQ1R1W7_9FLAO|nr:hypothetical protein [Muriicola marianensis]GGD54442.1 hypothetical protein GCM10011361_21350 [Muriicola marianensis]